MNAIATLFSILWKYSKGKRAHFLTYFALFIIANILFLFEPYVIGSLLNKLQEALLSPQLLVRSELFYSFRVVLGLTLGFWLLHGPARVLEISMSNYIHIRFIEHLFSVLVSLPISWHKDHHSGNVANRTKKASKALQDFSSNTFNFIEMTVRLTGSLLAIFLISKTSALIAALITLISFSLVLTFDKRLIKYYSSINQREHFTAEAFHDYLTNIFTVISLRLETQAQSEISKRVSSYRIQVLQMALLQESKWFLASFCISLMVAGILAQYVFSSIGAREIPLAGTLFMLYEYVQKIGTTFYLFAFKYSLAIQQYADIQTLEPILKAEPKHNLHSFRLPEGWKDISLSHLNFTYKDEQNEIHHLKDISLFLQKGQKIALIGKSGSGKSTLLTLIRGLQKPQSVDVICDNRQLPEGLTHLASHVTLIPQDPEIFAGSIEYNITMDQEASLEEIMSDIEMVQFSSVLARLPQKLQTNIAEKGVNLSGGEKQRLALARGLFAARKSDIILLDEPTSSVDSENEWKIYKNLFKHFANTCIVSSIHKLHLLPLFDEIYVLDQGQIVEKGTFYELLRGKGAFNQLWQAYTERQKESFKDFLPKLERAMSP